MVRARSVLGFPPAPGEQEAITRMSYDTDDRYRLRPRPLRPPNEELIFDAPEIFTAEIRPADRMPGILLLRLTLTDDTTHDNEE
jgi:hypothetical protein